MTPQINEAPLSTEALLLQRLSRFGVTSWPEVLLCAPIGHEDYAAVSSLKHAIDTGGLENRTRHLFALVVTSEPTVIESPKKRVCLSATDGRLVVKIVFFYSHNEEAEPWLKLSVGQRIIIKAPLQAWGSSLQIVYPVIVDEGLIGRTVPVYAKQRAVLADGVLFEATRHALKNHLQESVDLLISKFDGLTEKTILERARIESDSLESVLLAAHQPNTVCQGTWGIAALRQLAALSIVEGAKRMRPKAPNPSSTIPISPAMLQAAIERLPFRLTNDQKEAVEDIVVDLASSYPMRRLLSGDVGSGKSVCIYISAYLTISTGGWVVILLPNGHLVDQFVSGFKSIYPEVPVLAVTSVSGEQLPKEPTVLIGTTALLSRVVKSAIKPALICVDEQQKFSVQQRTSMLSDSGNYLESTATPIPRTTALITHAALDVSTIAESPVERNIQTYLVDASEAQRMFTHTKKLIGTGGKVAVIYPLVNESASDKKSVESAFPLWEALFPGRVVLIHGQMPNAEKINAIRDLKEGHKQIAIASSILEVGSDIPGLRSLIVVHADLFGTATLHQFRGRVAREGGRGYFFLYLPEPVKPETHQRLNLLVEKTNGFELAELDAQMRGYGDLVEDSQRQSGNTTCAAIRCVELTPADIQFINTPIER